MLLSHCKTGKHIIIIPMTDPCMLYMVTWIPSIYPLYVSIYIAHMDPIWDILSLLLSYIITTTTIWLFNIAMEVIIMFNR